MQVRTSILDGKTIVMEVEPGDAGPIVDLLEQRPNGYAVFGEEAAFPFAVIDGRIREQGLTDVHVLAIEAHELGHILTGSTDEPTAEYKGIELLEAHGHAEAAALLMHRGVIPGCM